MKIPLNTANITTQFESEKSQMAIKPRCMQFILPDDLVFDILCRLPIESITRFKSVCKAWYCITKDPLFIRLQLSRSNVHPPKLLLTRNAKSMSCFLTEISEFKATKLIDINDFEKPIVMCSFNGLICLASSTHLDPLKICNPITREFLKLPHSKFTDRIKCHRVALGYDNITKRYKVVRSYRKYADVDPCPSRVEILTLGEAVWKKLSSGKSFYHERDGPVFCNGAFYWITGQSHDYQLLQLDVSSEEFFIAQQPFHAQLPGVWPSTSLLNLEGRLMLAVDDFQFFYILGVNGSKHYFMKEDLKCNGIDGNPSIFFDVDLISMPSPDNYILGLAMMQDLWRRTKFLVKYHPQNKTMTPFCFEDFNAMSFKPSLLSPNMAMSSGKGGSDNAS